MLTRTKKNAKSIAIIAFAVVFCIVIFAVRLSYSTARYPALVSACDALTAAGLIYILWASVLYFAKKGALDGLFYAAHNIARCFKSRKDSTYVGFYDFVQSREHNQSSFSVFLVCGGIMFAAGMILLVAVYVLPQ